MESAQLTLGQMIFSYVGGVIYPARQVAHN